MTVTISTMLGESSGWFGRLWEAMTANINVPMWQWWISQAIGIVGLFVLFACWQAKAKNRTLLLVTLARCLSAVAAAFLDNWIMSAFFAISAVRGGCFMWVNANRADATRAKKNISLGFLGLFVVVTAAFMIFTRTWWFDWILITLAVMFTIAEWMKDIHIMRVVQFVVSAATIVNMVRFVNPIGVIQATAVMLSIVVFYVRWVVRKRRSPQSTCATA